MNILPISITTEEILPILGAFVAFCFFLLTVVLGRLGYSKDVYRKINRIHKYGAIYYVSLVVTIAYVTDSLSSDFGIALVFGIYIYYSMHYVLLFPIIGLCRKSISIMILDVLSEASFSGMSMDIYRLRVAMEQKDAGIESIRSSRLEQMLILGFAIKIGDQYKICTKGKVVHLSSELFLRIWNQARL